MLGTIIRQNSTLWSDWNFRLATKAPAFSPGSLTRDKILSNCGKSLEALGLAKIDLYYLHGPDSQTPIEEQVDAMAELHASGKFERWGVSNISAEVVRNMHKYAVSKGYAPPKVYQGVYNPLHRTVEEGLFPVLKDLDMVFYGYSPLAGGLFAKDIDQILKPEKGTRYDEMKVFGGIYLSERNVAGLRTLTEKCNEHGITVLEATMRWFMHHSKLREVDGVILGASTQQQIERSLGFAHQGPLSDALVDAFQDLWTPQKDNPPAFGF